MGKYFGQSLTTIDLGGSLRLLLYPEFHEFHVLPRFHDQLQGENIRVEKGNHQWYDDAMTAKVALIPFLKLQRANNPRNDGQNDKRLECLEDGCTVGALCQRP